MKSVADGLKAIREGAGRLGSARGWLIVELALTAVLAVQAARIVLMFLEPPPRPAAAVAVSAADTGIFGRFDAFFRTGGQGALAEVTGAEGAQMRLYGVRAGGADGGSAIIGMADGRQVSVAVGETVAPGLILKSVAADHVVLARGASLSRLIFTEKPEGAPAPPPPPPGDQLVAPGPVVTGVAVPPRTTPPPGAASPAPTVDPARLLAQASLRPRLRGARIDGFTVGARGDSPLLNAAGLKSGDVILSVNGVPLNSIERVAELRDELTNSDAAEVRFERNGQAQTTTIRTGR